MSNKLNVIIIDPVLKIIASTEIEDSLQGLQHAIGDHNIELVYLDNDDIMYVDGEGLFRSDQQFFLYNDRPFAGKAVVLGNDPEEGGNKNANSSVTDISNRVRFHTAIEISQMNLGY